MSYKILAVDNETDFLDSLKRGLLTSGFKNVLLESNPLEALNFFENGDAFDIALIDITMPEMNGIDLLERIKHFSPETECIMLTAIDEARTAVDAMRKGAYDYLLKPVQKEELILSINRALERKRLCTILDLGKGNQKTVVSNQEAFRHIITRSKKMIRILREAELHAISNVPILITGDSGTGKELLAKAVHAASHRSKYNFVPVNMASITPTLFDSEFFGYTKGAFTGAEKDRAGFFEHASQGTLFLDEIGTLSLDLQGKLLRVLQDGEYIRIGENLTKKTNARFISATNEDLEQLVKKKTFRRDLFFRLKGGWIHLPPLKNRKEDIPLLIKNFLNEFQTNNIKEHINENAMSLLMAYEYPGNLRELKGIIQSAINLSQGKTIQEKHLPNNIQKLKTYREHDRHDHKIIPLFEIEKQHILKVYEKTGKNKTQTAKLLEIGLNTLRRKLNNYDMS